MRDLSHIIQNQLSLIGRSGSTEYPHNSQDPIDVELHKLYVDKMAASFFRTQCEATQDDVLTHINPANLDRVVEQTVLYDIGQSDTLLNTENYSLLLKTSKPVTSVDSKRLRTELIKLGVDVALIDKATEKASTTRAPAKTFTVLLNT